jgi:hypothetical protein
MGIIITNMSNVREEDPARPNSKECVEALGIGMGTSAVHCTEYHFTPNAPRGWPRRPRSHTIPVVVVTRAQYGKVNIAGTSTVIAANTAIQSAEHIFVIECSSRIIVR